MSRDRAQEGGSPPAAQGPAALERPARGRLAGALPRRTFLRGVGTILALPSLEAMLPKTVRAAAQAKPPVRLAFLFSPNGVSPSAWAPKGLGRDYQLSPTLEPLAELKNEVLVLSGLSQKMGDPLGDGAGDHARSAASFLTGQHPYKTAGRNIRAGVSVDQHAASVMGRDTPLASLELGLEPGASAGNCDSGYSCAYSSAISWKTPTMPMAKEINPKLVFERLFGTPGVDPRERARRDYLRSSILDLVRSDSERLERQLGVSDRRKVDEYFSSVRDVERRIELASHTPARLPAGIVPPAGVPHDFETHARLMFELLGLAFQTDTTRVATLMLGNEGSNRAYSMVGAKDGHHSLSHHRNKQEMIVQIQAIDRFLVGQYAQFLAKLRSIREGEGTVLDNCLVLYGSGLGDGNEHTHHNLPILLGGRGGGTVTPGRHLKCESRTPLNNLFVAMLDRAGVPTPQFGDSTGALRGL